MRAVIQRVTEASVTVEGNICGKIANGLIVLVGIEDEDNDEDIDWLSKKIVNMRIFNDENGVMNKSLIEVNGELLIISQFTLMAQTKKGNRPSYIRASKGDYSQPMYEKFCSVIGKEVKQKIQTGIFGADMKVSLLNDGPVTIIMDTKNKE
jgi:D-aminoacyl-tRNA deacylase